MTIFASRARRLDRRVKELTQEKEELLKSSKVQSTTMESVKVQIETLLKVRLVRICV
jgi:THO complex subunit 5